MTYANIERYDGWEDSPVVCMSRVRTVAGVDITQAAISSIACKVFDLDGTTPDTAETTPAVTVATSVYDALQTDNRWSKDDTGYNFAFTVPRASFPVGDHTYRVEFVFTPVSGEAFVGFVGEVYARPIRSS